MAFIRKAIPPVLPIYNKLIFPSVAGQSTYLITLGNFIADNPNQSTLDVDTTGSGVFVPVPFLTGYTHYRRSSPGTPASVSDAAIGFKYVAGAVPNGWTFRFIWNEPRLVGPPIAIAKVRVPLDTTTFWNANTGNAPNGVTIPIFQGIQGIQCEFWRQTFRSGGPRHCGGSFPTRFSLGRRYLPYYRGGIDDFTFAKSDFSPAGAKKRSRYKVCYYDPRSGGRSTLSADTIVVCSTTPDAVNGRSPVRSASSLWIE